LILWIFHISDWNCPCRALLWCMLTWYTLNLMLFLTSCPLFLVPLVSQLFSLSLLSGVHASTSSMGHMSRKSGTENWVCVLYLGYTVCAALRLTSEHCCLFVYQLGPDLNSQCLELKNWLSIMQCWLIRYCQCTLTCYVRGGIQVLGCVSFISSAWMT
jgi:hypothetical protein